MAWRGRGKAIAQLSTIAPAPNWGIYIRDLSCRDLCSLLEKALAQNWHLYRFSLLCPDSGLEALRPAAGEGVGNEGPASMPATADISDGWRGGLRFHCALFVAVRPPASGAEG